MVSMFTVIVPEDIPMEDTKDLVIYWHETHYFATKKYTKLLARAIETGPACSTITNWIRALTRGEDIHGHASGSGRLPDDSFDTLVINALEESPFHSVRMLASTIKIPPTAGLRHLQPAVMLCETFTLFPICYPWFKSGPSRIGNRIEESALLGETLWLARHSNG
jgi:hypothetical protein